ncbi:hypothetical protein JCGZ_10118 [Jatropha curcas]|uniref:Bacterial Ig-like domain-containing protein n=1 Tax=Jatropha curcas TaxID=180498 RepID=A0A067LG58_JATCU|nr:hypothetical protein JCGZ_10118 [Jatropha curcas]
MGLLSFFKLVFCIATISIGVLDSAESTVIIHFHGTPPKHSRFSTAVFRYSVQRPDGSNACKNSRCFISCELDGHKLRSCPADTIVLKNLTVNHEHSFLLNVTTHDGERNSSSYSWFIDTVPPTAVLFSEQNYTNAAKVTIDVTFSEACTQMGGFKCFNSSNCDVILDGPAYVQASSLRIIKPNIKYRLDIILLLKSVYGRVVVRMADNSCIDKAGNIFTRTNGSVIIIHFDRRPVLVDLWMPIPSYVMEINGYPRTVLATNKMDDLKIFLDFSVPIMNSTVELLNALRVNSGSILPLNNVARTEIITVELETRLVMGRTSVTVSPVAALTVLYDSTKPTVGLSTSSPNVTKVSNLNVIAEFTKPVFGFEASMIKVEGGKLTRQELSRALYSLTVLAVSPNMVLISIPAGKVNDIAGNQNLASNQLQVKHLALQSFVTVGVLATSMAAAALSVSSANLVAIGTLASESTKIVASNPSMNLHGMFGHLQVLVLSDSRPIEYSETTKGLMWLIPRQKVPWKKDGTSTWPNHVYLAKQNLHIQNLGFPNHKRANSQLDLNTTDSSKVPFLNGRFGDHNLSMKDSPYGLPLHSREYFTYFLREEPLSASNFVKRMVDSKGWEDMEMNLFWLGIGGGSLFIIHVVILLFLKWRIGKVANGILSVPRFELLLLILALPCISQSSAFVMRGGTMWGIVTGALLLVIPAALILSVSLFLAVVIFPGSSAQYKEIRQVDITDKWYTKLRFLFVARPSPGKWFFKDGLSSSSFIQHFGILFEDRKGPPLYIFPDQNDPRTSNWTESGPSGIGSMRALSSDESNEEIKIPLLRRILGCARCSYIVLDLSRRVSLGIISGATSSQTSRGSIFALAITIFQFICLIALKPYIRRGVHLVESISLLCEAAIFSLSMATKNLNPLESTTQGYIMLVLLFLTFIAQIINEWYSLIKCILRLCCPNNSFRMGLKFAAKGLILPFLPTKHWPKTGLSSVPPPSPETELGRRATSETYGAMTAMVVPVLSPGSPLAVDVTQRTSSITAEPKNELKKLRELAKASFSRVSKS